ncbi:MAG: HlyD family efflux transporter periplasmic adaptor subunit [Bacteroidota bacterium]
MRFRKKWSDFEQSLYYLESEISNWKHSYLLTAPIEGKVIFTSIVQEQQYLETNHLVCYIQNFQNEVFATVFVPHFNLGKVNIGQGVNIKFPAFPFREFGILQGKIASIASVSEESGYTAKISLNNNLKINLGHKINYKEGLLGSAEILLEKKFLFQKILNWKDQ